MSLPGVLHDQMDLPLAQPLRRAGLDARPRLDDGFDLAALERKLRRGRARKSGHHLELGPDQLIHEAWGDDRRRGRAGASDDDLTLLCVLDAAHTGLVPAMLDLDIRIDAADP